MPVLSEPANQKRFLSVKPVNIHYLVEFVSESGLNGVIRFLVGAFRRKRRL